MQKQIIDIPLFGGLDTKTEQKSVPKNKTLALENAVMVKTGEVQKRNGYSAISMATTSNVILQDDNTIHSANSIHSKDDQLVLIGSDGGLAGETVLYGPHMFSKTKSSDKWMTTGDYYPCTITTNTIGTPATSIAQVSVAGDESIRAYVYEEDSATFFDIRDVATGAVYQEGSSIKVTSELPQAQLIEDGYGKFIMCLAVSNVGVGTKRIGGRIIDTTDPTDFGSNVNIAGTTSNIHDDQLFDFDIMDFTADGYQQGLMAWKRNSDSKIQICILDSQGNVTNTVVTDSVPKNAICIRYLKDKVTSAERIFLIYQDNSTGYLKAAAYNPDLTVSVAETTITTTLSAATLNNITVTLDPQAGDEKVRIFASQTDATAADYSIYSSSLSWAIVNGSARTLYHEGLASKAFNYNDQPYVWTVHESTLQNTYFLRTITDSTDHNLVAKVFAGSSGGVRKSGLSNAINPYASGFSIGCAKHSRILSNSKRDYQLAEINLDLDPAALQSVEIGNTLLIGGGIVTGYDGQSQELGFMLHPEGITDGGTAVSGGAMSDGTYAYVAVYSWTDRNGNVYKSAPSPSVSITLSGGGTTQTQQITYSNLNHSDVNNKAAACRVEIYRTLAGPGSIYYLVAEDENLNDPFANNSTTAEVGAEDDTSVADNEVLYTTGGRLPNVVPPASNILTASKNRAFLVPMDDRETVWFSKEKIYNVGIEFAEELQIRIEAGGDNTGLAVLDDKVIIFKDREIYFVSGEGPNDFDQGGFSPVRQVSSDVGCVDAASIVNIGSGIMFKSHKGIYILNRSLQVGYIGAAVEKWNQFDIVSADIINDKNQVRFILSKGKGALVYDYYHKQWSTFTNHPAKAAVVQGGVYHWLKDDGTVRLEDDSFADINYSIQMKVRTGWIKLAGLQGYQRINAATILGEFKSPHTLTCNIYYDYDEVNIGQTNEITSSDAMSGNEALQYEIHIKKQKCNAIQFEIFDSTQDRTLESCSLSSLALRVGVKKGTNKLPARKRE